jgi:hypothetical protein
MLVLYMYMRNVLHTNNSNEAYNMVGGCTQTDNAFILDTTIMAPVCITGANIQGGSGTGCKYYN